MSIFKDVCYSSLHFSHRQLGKMKTEQYNCFKLCMIVAYDNRNILSEKKLGVTDLVFELSALEFEFLLILGHFKGNNSYINLKYHGFTFG